MSAPAATEIVVAVPEGRLAGRAERGVSVFRGVPYATAERFAPPRAPEPWSGVRAATEYGPACPQPPIRDNLLIRPEVERAMFGLTDEPMSEDCLTLNLWTPAADDGARPVLVSYHGGGFKSGSGNPRSAPWFDGTRLAQRGDVVVVSVNHRIGLLGFLALPEVPGSGNAGILDLNAALAWLRDNVGAFGGDPGRVTVFGESGGGSKVTTQLAMPSAAGLLHRAASQSGAGGPVSAAAAAGVTAAVAEELGTDDVEALRVLPVQRLVDAALAVSRRGVAFGPVIDGDTLPRPLVEAFAAGVGADVPLLLGWTRDEASVFLREPRDLAWDALPEAAGEYRERDPRADPWTLLMRLRTDQQFRLPALALAQARANAAGTYVFEFAWETPVLGGSLGAGHGVDVSFPFENTDLHPATAGSASARRLAPAVADAWIALARDGDPNHPGLPEWPRYGPDGATLVFADAPRLEYRQAMVSP